MKQLHLDTAKHIIKETKQKLETKLRQDKVVEENLNSGLPKEYSNEEEMYNPNLRVVDLPKSSTENMFVLIGGGGNPDDYDANGKWLGGGDSVYEILSKIINRLSKRYKYLENKDNDNLSGEETFIKEYITYMPGWTDKLAKLKPEAKQDLWLNVKKLKNPNVPKITSDSKRIELLNKAIHDSESKYKNVLEMATTTKDDQSLVFNG